MTDPTGEPAHLRALEIRRTTALVERDLAVIEQLHAPDYELITPAGRVLTLADYLAAMQKGPFYTAWAIGEMRCRLSPEMAVLRYQALLGFPSGRQVSCWHTDAYQRRDGRWQAVWSQATALPTSG